MAISRSGTTTEVVELLEGLRAGGRDTTAIVATAGTPIPELATQLMMGRSTSSRWCRPASPRPCWRCCAPRLGEDLAAAIADAEAVLAEDEDTALAGVPTPSRSPSSGAAGRSGWPRRPPSSCASRPSSGPSPTPPWSTATARSASPPTGRATWAFGEVPDGLAEDVRRPVPTSSTATSTRWPTWCACTACAWSRHSRPGGPGSTPAPVTVHHPDVTSARPTPRPHCCSPARVVLPDARRRGWRRRRRRHPSSRMPGARSLPREWAGRARTGGMARAARPCCPGLVDIHCHGGSGGEFGPDADSARAAAAHHHGHGTTTVVGSLVSAARRRCSPGRARWVELVAAGELAGIHLEGPFLSTVRCGAQNPAALIDADLALVAALAAAGGQGAFAHMTWAPERDRWRTASRPPSPASGRSARSATPTPTTTTPLARPAAVAAGGARGGLPAQPPTSSTGCRRCTPARPARWLPPWLPRPAVRPWSS